MDFKTFLEHFDTIAEAPGGIQKLRELILDMAVQGKLVPQNSDDEPASELLKRIKNEFKELINQKKIRQAELLPVLQDDEVPFNKPIGWEWSRLGEIVRVSSGDNLTSHKMADEGKIPVFGGNGITGYHDKANVHKPTLVIGRVGFYCGSVHITPKLAWVTDNAFITTFSENCIYIHFLYWLLKAIDLQQNNSATAQPVISGGKIYSIPVTLPPLAEQKRIVEKVDELMALCERYEAGKQTRDNRQQKLRESAIAGLINAETDKDLDAGWAFVRDNWHNLSQNPEDVSSLRQVILKLAVQGKLIPQFSSDEPASVLLNKLELERNKLIQAGKIKKSANLPPIEYTDMPFTVPDNWEWVRLGMLAEVITKGSSPKWQGVNYVDSGVLFITSENVRNYVLDISEPKYVEFKFNEIEPRSILHKKDILMNIVGASIGRTAIYELDETANINQAVCLIRLISSFPLIDYTYMLHFFNSPICVGFMFDKQVDNARANLSMGNISKFPIPIPPLAEQKRIVVKVDELMKLCDQLEESLRLSRQRAESLAASAISHLTSIDLGGRLCGERAVGRKLSGR